MSRECGRQCAERQRANSVRRAVVAVSHPVIVSSSAMTLIWVARPVIPWILAFHDIAADMVVGVVRDENARVDRELCAV